MITRYGNYMTNSIKINYVSINGIIIVGWISQYDDYEKKYLKTKSFKGSINDLNEYLIKHNDLYQSNIKLSELNKQIFGKYKVASGCGYNGNYVSDEYKTMLKYVEKGKVNKLNKLLTSFSSELQTIGAIGLIMEDELNERQKTIIPHLKDRNSQIYSCGVCSYRYNEPFSHRISYF